MAVTAPSTLRLELAAPPDVRVVASPLLTSEMLLRDALEAINLGRREATRRQRIALATVEQAVPLRTLTRLVPFIGDVAPGPVPLQLARGDGSIEDELDRVWPLAAGALAADAALVPLHLRSAAIERFEAEPERPTDDLLRVVARVWERVVRPTWPAIVGAVGRERGRIGAIAAAVGWRDALGTLHPELRMDGDGLETGILTSAASLPLDGRALLVAPVATGSRACIVGDDAVTVLLPDLAVRDAEVDLLGRALGPARARLLAALAVPSTTTDLAGLVGRSPGTVSGILGVLHEAGLVERERHGLRVWYRRSYAGDALVRALS